MAVFPVNLHLFAEIHITKMEAYRNLEKLKTPLGQGQEIFFISLETILQTTFNMCELDSEKRDSSVMRDPKDD